MLHPTLHSFKSFAHGHDDVPAFHATFLVATFLAAAVLNLGFFLILILLHMMLDFVKYREVHRYSYRMTLKAMLLESISDIALFLMGLTVAVYFSHTFMLAAAGGLLRSELTVLKALGTLIPKVIIIEHLVTIAVSVRSYLDTEVLGLHGKCTRLQVLSMYSSVTCVVLLLVSVGLYAHNQADLLAVLQHELIPSL
jgi:hypothetical protein